MHRRRKKVGENNGQLRFRPPVHHYGWHTQAAWAKRRVKVSVNNGQVHLRTTPLAAHSKRLDQDFVIVHCMVWQEYTSPLFPGKNASMPSKLFLVACNLQSSLSTPQFSEVLLNPSFNRHFMSLVHIVNSYSRFRAMTWHFLKVRQATI